MLNRIGKFIYEKIVRKVFKYEPLPNIKLESSLEFQGHILMIESISMHTELGQGTEVSFKCRDDILLRLKRRIDIEN